jgi:hypothetical protein
LPSGRASALFFAAFTLGAAATAHAQPLRDRPRYARPGVALGVGIGGQYAGAGAQLTGFVPLAPRPWTLSAGFAFGRVAEFASAGSAVGREDHVYGPAFTLGASFGHRHRLTAALGWGAVLGQAVLIEGLRVDAVARSGAFAEAGYEFLGASGLFVRFVPLGVAYVAHPLLQAGNEWSYSGSFGVGWKPW